MSEIEVKGRDLVINTDGRVQLSPVPEDFSPKMFRHIVAAADMLYRQEGVLPTANRIMRSWEGFNKSAVVAALASEEFKAALAIRGIEWDPKQGLSAEQLNAVLLLQDPSDSRTLKAKLDSIGVPFSKYQAWMRNPTFSRQVNKMAEDNLADAVPMVLDRLVSAADRGDMQAINKVLEVTGRYNPQQQELHNAMQVISIMVEAMEKFVPREVLSSVMEEVQGKTRLMSLTQIVKETR